MLLSELITARIEPADCLEHVHPRGSSRRWTWTACHPDNDHRTGDDRARKSRGPCRPTAGFASPPAHELLVSLVHRAGNGKGQPSVEQHIGLRNGHLDVSAQGSVVQQLEPADILPAPRMRSETVAVPRDVHIIGGCGGSKGRNPTFAPGHFGRYGSNRSAGTAGGDGPFNCQAPRRCPVACAQTTIYLPSGRSFGSSTR